MVTVGVAIPSIPPRGELLARALRSVCLQSRPADRLSVAVDHARLGAAATRNDAWRVLDTDYVAFLDDDDELLPPHLERLLAVAAETDADMVFPWFEVVGGSDPFPETFGTEWDPAAPRQTTITALWRRQALIDIGGFQCALDAGTDALGNRAGEDFESVKVLNATGGKIVHLGERTWQWHHHGRNTMGLPTRW